MCILDSVILLPGPEMPTPEEDVYINKVSFSIMLKLSKALDAGDKWQDLLAAIDEAELDGPPLEPDYVHVLENCSKRRQSPTETLLNELGQKGYKVRDLKHWLRLAELKQALDLLEGNNIAEESFQKKYIEAAIEKGGSVEVEIVKCVTLGPPEAGKTQLKRALTGNMEESTESTPVSTGAEVIMERYFEGESIWEPMGKCELQSALHKTVDANKYNVKHKKPPESNVSEVHVSIEKASVTPSPAIIEDPTPEAGSDSTEELKKDLIEEFTKLQKRVLDNFSGSQGNRHLNGVRIIHFIDSGGQPSFFDLHPVVSTSRAVYLIVYNSAEGLDARPKITYRRPGDSPLKQKREIPNPKQTNLDLIKSSLLTLDHCTSKFNRLEEKARRCLNIIDIPTEPTTQLPGVIVGSRASSRQHKTDDSDVIRRHCCHIPMCRDNVMGKVHFVESRKPMSGIYELRDALKKVDCKFSIKRFPLKWFQCQLVFWSAEDPHFFALTYYNLQALCEEGGFVSGDEEFRALVTTFHMLGIFSCPDLDLPDVDEELLPLSPVFTNPDVLFEQVTTLLEVPFLNPLDYVKNGPAIDKLQKSGIITRESLTLLGIPDTIASFRGFHSYLLKFLLKWGLAAEMKKSGSSSGSGCGQLLHRELFIPSILLPRKDYNFALPPGFVALPSFALTILNTNEDDYCIPQGLFPHFIVNIMNRHEEGYLIKVARHEAEIRCRDVLAITKKADKGTKLPYTIYVVDDIDHISVHITLARKGEDSASCHSDCRTIVNDLKASMEKAYSHLFGYEGTSSVIIGCKCTCDDKKSCHLAQVDCLSQDLRCLFPDRESDVHLPFSETLKTIFQAHGSRKRSPPGISTSVSSTKRKLYSESDARELPHCQALQLDSDLDIINSADDFTKYVDSMTHNLELLGGALGVGDTAAAVVSSSADPHSICIRILRAWFDATPEPTWTKFCEKLQVSKVFAHLRSTIEKDFRERLKASGGSEA